MTDTQVTWLTQEAHDRLKAELDQLIAHRPIIAAEINSPPSQRLRRDTDPTLVADQAVLHHRELSELPMHIHPDIAHHLTCPFLDRQRGTAGTERHLRIRARGAAGPVAGATNY